MEDKNIKVELTQREVELINEACEWWMGELKENSTFEISNNKKFYEFWDIRDKITGTITKIK